jgi:hypothetical protein
MNSPITPTRPPETNADNGYVEVETVFNLTDSSNGYVDDQSVINLTVSKLSKLQRWMLAHALRNRMAEGRTGHDLRGSDLYAREVFVGFYGFREYDRYGDPEWDSLRRPGFKRFHPDSIGRSAYNSAHAAISRAANRLAARGLAVCIEGGYWGGIDLTDAGVAVAEKLASTVAPQAPSETRT